VILQSCHCAFGAKGDFLLVLSRQLAEHILHGELRGINGTKYHTCMPYGFGPLTWPRRWRFLCFLYCMITTLQHRWLLLAELQAE
jgi:hypothetical protein